MQSVPTGSGELSAAAYDALELAVSFHEHARAVAARSISGCRIVVARRGRHGFRSRPAGFFTATR